MMVDREWYNLAGAAAQIACTEADVLHLAATERLKLCYLLRGVPATEFRYNKLTRELLKTSCVPQLHGFVGLTAFCAGELEIRSSTTAQYFLDLLRPDYEWRLSKAAVRADRPEITVRGEEVDVTIDCDEVVIRAVDLQTFDETAVPAHAKPGRDHVSDRLAKLNQAPAKFWTNANPTDRGTHPKNDEVAKWLTKNAGFTETLAKKAATIIRPEWAPSGRKPEE